MKIQFLIFLIPIFSFSQTIESVQKGYYNAVVGDSVLQNRTTERKAKDDGFNYALKHGFETYKITFPQEVNVALEGFKKDSVIEIIDMTPVRQAVMIQSFEIVNGDIIIGFKDRLNTIKADGGYDLLIDGVDDNLHLPEMSRTVSGLDLTVSHTFRVQSRYSPFLDFNVDFYNSTLTTYYPQTNEGILKYVVDFGNGFYQLFVKELEGSTIPEGRYDVFINGVNLNNHGYFLGNTLLVKIDDVGSKEFQVLARHTQMSPQVFIYSNKINI